MAKEDVASGRARDGQLLLATVQGPAYYSRGIFVLSFGFLGVFSGFQASQALQSSLNATLGFINLACLYGSFTVFCVAAPSLIPALEARVGLRFILFLSALVYVAMAVSNVWTGSWALPITMNVLVGVVAPFLWTCQNDYVGRCAFHAAAAAGHRTVAVTETGLPSGSAGVQEDAVEAGQVDEAESEAEARLATMTARFNSHFFSIFQFAGSMGNIVASSIMLAFGGQRWLREVLFFVLAGLMLVGAFLFLLMPLVLPAGGGSNQDSAAPSLGATAMLAVGNLKMGLMVPLIFTNGMMIAFILGDYPTDVICPVAGASVVGYVVAMFFGVNALATAVWGKLIGNKFISRRTVYVIGGLCQIAFLVLKLLWHPPRNYVQQHGSWRMVAEPAKGDVAIPFALVALFAIGDSYWESGPTGTLQNFFLGTADIVPAMANYKLWQSLGYAVQFVIGAQLGGAPLVRGSILLAGCALSIVSLLALDFRSSLQ